MNDEAVHKEVYEAIGAYVVGGLDGAETTAIRRHLERCAECRRAVAELEGIHELLESATLAVEPPPELEDRVVAAIEQAANADVVLSYGSDDETSVGRDSTKAGRRMRIPLSSLSAAAVVVVLVAIAINYQLSRSDNQESAGPAPQPVIDTPSPASAYRLVAAEQLTTSTPQLPYAPSALPSATATVRDFPSASEPWQYNPASPGGEFSPRLSGATWECEITVWGLEPGQLYEVWFKGRKGISSGGSFRVENFGIKTIRVSTGVGLKDLDEVIISAEPDDGDPAPNGKAVLRAEIPKSP